MASDCLEVGVFAEQLGIVADRHRGNQAVAELARGFTMASTEPVELGRLLVVGQAVDREELQSVEQAPQRMNWAMPMAPAEEPALGSKFDSAISWAASSAAETFQRAAACSSGPRKREGTNEGRPPLPATAPSPPPPTEFPASEQGGGPAAKP